jgi:hypothetical protein
VLEDMRISSIDAEDSSLLGYDVEDFLDSEDGGSSLLPNLVNIFQPTPHHIPGDFDFRGYVHLQIKLVFVFLIIYVTENTLRGVAITFLCDICVVPPPQCFCHILCPEFKILTPL